MLVLVINCGSSSIKYKLFDVDHRRLMAAGLLEKIGEASSFFTHNYSAANGEVQKYVDPSKTADHHEGLQRILALLMDPHKGVIGNKAEITAIGHRVVHGGDTFHEPTLIDDRVTWETGPAWQLSQAAAASTPPWA